MNKMSAKIKWAIGLLILRIVGAISAGMDNAKMFGVSYDYSYYFVFSALYEQIPTLAAVILIFYNHKQPKTENAGFTLMQKWIFALVWVQHAYAFIAFSLANSLTSVWTKVLAGCAWLALITWLLYSAWKNQKTVEQENVPEQKTESKPNSLGLEAKPKSEEPQNNEVSNIGTFCAIVFAIVVLTAVVGLVIGVVSSVLHSI